MDIPGYYFDKEKKRYFKIEKAGTGQIGAAWSSDKVKKRKLEDQAAAFVLRQAELNRGRIRRSQALNDPLTGGFLVREYGTIRKEVPIACFAADLINKGAVRDRDGVLSEGRQPGQNLSMCIITDDTDTGLGVGYVANPEGNVCSFYIPRDRNGRINHRVLENYQIPSPQRSPYYESPSINVADIKFHRRSGHLLMPIGLPQHHYTILDIVQPLQQAARGDRPGAPRFLLPHFVTDSRYEVSDWYQGTDPITRAKEFWANVVGPGPDWCDSNICIVGANRGILKWSDPRIRKLDWIIPHRNNGMFAANNPFRDTFAVAYHNNQGTVILGGGRPGNCLLADMRERASQYQRFGHPTAITHIKPINDHHVLISGLKNEMHIYDLRKMRPMCRAFDSNKSKEDSVGSDNRYQAVVSFPHYKNEAHIGLGFDVDKETGIVAAAHDDGTVSLHSLQSGHKLISPDIDQITSPGRPIKALQFAKMPGDANSTLFISHGQEIKAFSFGTRNLEDEA